MARATALLSSTIVFTLSVVWSAGIVLAQDKTGILLAQDNSVKSDSLNPENEGSNPARSYASMDECMAIWDKSTHMTKVEWRETCKRLMKVEPSVQ